MTYAPNQFEDESRTPTRDCRKSFTTVVSCLSILSSDTKACYLLRWRNVTSHFLLHADFILHITLPGETTADSLLHSSITTNFLLCSFLSSETIAGYLFYYAPLHCTLSGNTTFNLQ
jgi:hypothetical protein